LYEDKQFDYLNDSQRGFIVNLDGKMVIYVKQRRVHVELREVRVHHISPLTSRDKRKMAKVVSDNKTRLF
jgi:hypothetical protein